eukprot:1289726-Karenia_brevis.AAC.1
MIISCAWNWVTLFKTGNKANNDVGNNDDDLVYESLMVLTMTRTLTIAMTMTDAWMMDDDDNDH